MKYAIVDAQTAVQMGLKETFHRRSKDGRRMIVNENELALTGDPGEQAKKMNGYLVNGKDLHILIQTEEWQQIR
jgi:hypothetical protein